MSRHHNIKSISLIWDLLDRTVYDYNVINILALDSVTHVLPQHIGRFACINTLRLLCRGKRKPSGTASYVENNLIRKICKF
ncbi:hypothetical protein D3C73_1592580 [compost metagenome]